MASTEWSDEECDDGSAILSALGERYEKILVQIGALPNEDIAQDLLNECDKQDLRDLRAKVFKLVQEKAVRCLSSDNGGIFAPDAAFVKQGRVPLSRSFIDQWEPVNRRLESKLASDTVSYMNYVLGFDDHIPEKLVKGLTLDKGVASTVREEDRQLCKDLASPNGGVEIRVVESSNEKGTILVTIDKPQTTREKTVTTGNEVGDVQQPPKKTPAEKSQSTVQSSTTAKDDNGVGQQNPCTDLGTPGNESEQASAKNKGKSVRVSVDKAINTEVSAVISKKFVNMATQTICTGEAGKPLTRTEFDSHMDFVERLCNETIDRVKKLEVWREAVERDNNEAHAEVVRNEVQKCRNMVQKSVVSHAKRSSARGPPIDARSQRVRSERKGTVCKGTSQRTQNEREDDVVQLDSSWEEDVADVEDNVMSEHDSPVPLHQGKRRGRGVSVTSRRIRRRSTPRAKRCMKGAISKHLQKRQDNAYDRQEGIRARDDSLEDRYDEDRYGGSRRGDHGDDVPVGRNGSAVAQQGVPKSSTQYSAGNGNRRNVASSSNNPSNEPEFDFSQFRCKRDPPTHNPGGRRFVDGEEDIPPPKKRQNMVPDNRNGGREPTTRNQEQTNAGSSRRDGAEPQTRKENGGANGGRGPAARNREQPSASNSTRGDADLSEYSSSNTSDESCIEMDSEVTYATVAAEDQWHVQRNKNNKRKRGKSDTMSVQILRSAPSTAKRVLYVQELDYSVCRCYEDLEENVYYHCKQRGIKPIDLCTIPVKDNREVAGCKVTVRDQDYRKTSLVSFWPKGCTVRDWRPKKKDQNKGNSDDKGSD